MLVRVDEQPLPVERHNLDVEGLLLRFDRPGRIQVMRADPGDTAPKHDGQEWNRPYDQLERAGIFEVRQIARPGVGRSVPPGGRENGEDRRDNDGEHDRHRIDQDRLVRVADRALRIEHRPIAAAKEQSGAKGRQPKIYSPTPPPEDQGPPRLSHSSSRSLEEPTRMSTRPIAPKS